MGYRESPPPAPLRDLVECAWERGGSGESATVHPDGCMDLIRMDGRIVVAGPDTFTYLSTRSSGTIAGLRFRPGALPRLLGVPASELRDQRVPLGDLLRVEDARPLDQVAAALAAGEAVAETAPWSLATLRHVTRSLASGAAVTEVADDVGWSPRTLHRQCGAVFGYGPATLRRILRLRRALRLLQRGAAPADVAARTGYADQPHLHREVRALTGGTVAQVTSGANRSTQLPSGSATVAYR